MKRTALNVSAVATAGTDYLGPLANASTNRICVANGAGGLECAPGGTATWTGYIMSIPGSISLPANTNGIAATCATTYNMSDNFIAYTKVTLTGNCTLTGSITAGSFTSGIQRIVEACQDGTGGRTLTWPSTYTPSAWAVSGTTTIQSGISTTASTCSTMTFISDPEKNKWLATGLGVTGQ